MFLREYIYFPFDFHGTNLFTKRSINFPFINWKIIGWFTEGNICMEQNLKALQSLLFSEKCGLTASTWIIVLSVSIRDVSSCPRSHHLSLGLIQNLPDLSLLLHSHTHQLAYCALKSGGWNYLKITLGISPYLCVVLPAWLLQGSWASYKLTEGSQVSCSEKERKANESWIFFFDLASKVTYISSRVCQGNQRSTQLPEEK